MKNKNIYIILLVLSAVISCTKEDTPTIDVPLDNRDRYTGNWLCSENGGGAFTIEITKKGNADTLKIKNFAGYGPSDPQAIAIVSDSMTIPSQNITPTAIHVSGFGVLNTTGAKLTMNYIADGNVITAICTH